MMRVGNKISRKQSFLKKAWTVDNNNWKHYMVYSYVRVISYYL